ncbi:4-hydroxy-3-methylbut-2-enyl diphosphate reductase [bacterium]|jgi:4-hydroxy-3-methylbut-2-enyl diphosphate reductase|nr:4-hydroxy-3-methylbut-2-enyl diphosphate reductase [bacterium]MBT6017686.1 4-hydroxy-3-methylbut-2-enyl diphosphate reductase [bacterium]MBT6777941.1 4-hydroxy-3-methylbut-2-enyl diphosphate reductase [bacterium]
MKILVAKDAGYCFGVRDAVTLAKKSGADYDEVYMLGDIVHNEQVVSDLSKKGSKVVKNLDEIPKDKPVLFRAHGTDPETWKAAQKKKLNIIDATCPLVTEIHEEIKSLEEEGRRTIIIGDHNHDEVVGIASQVKNATIISSAEEARSLKKMKRAGVVSQSTQMIENVNEILNILSEKIYDLRFVNTICYPTRRNHEQIKKLADTCDLMVVIGSYTSANSKRLTQLSLARNKNSFQVTCADELKKSWFSNIGSVGISAGASTPDDLIADVISKVKIFSKIKVKEEIYE